MSFLAIDLGTSFIKGAVLDLDALCIKYIHRFPFPDPVSGLPSLFYEVDPTEIVAAVRRLVSDLLPYAPDCSGVVMCTQMAGLVLTTDQGEPLSNYISWRDQRVLMPHPSGAGSYFEVLSERISPIEREPLGNELRVGQAISSLFWLAEEKQLPDAIPAALGDFVLAKLCGATPTVELTNAAAYGTLNLETCDWHDPVLSKLGLKKLHWPALRDFREPIGFLEVDSSSLPCYPPVGDQQCALAGAFLDSHELSINISTGSQVSMLTPPLELGDYQWRPFFDGRFLKTIVQIPAGRSLNLLLNLLCELPLASGRAQVQDPWPYITRAAEAVNTTDLRVDLAFFPSAVGDHGEIANIREENLTVGHLFRSAFQNMADNYYANALRLSPSKGWQNLVFSGGLALKLEILRDIICQKFQVDYRVCASSEDTLLGLLALALVASGRVESVEQATTTLLQEYEEG